VSAELATLARTLLAGLVLTAAVSLATALVWPVLRRRLARAHPAERARAAWLVSAAPALLSAWGVALCLAPGALGALGLRADHCALHPDHPHLCFAHTAGALSPALAAFLALAAASLVAAGARGLRALLRARRALARLAPGASAVGPGVAFVESRVPFSFAAGLLRPRVLVATALIGSLPLEQLRAVIEHERAHARRRDPLARLLARALSWAHLPALRRSLLAELALASEQACDAEAARYVGDRVAVAEAILAVERLVAGQMAPEGAGLAAFGESSVAERVRELLAPELTASGRGVRRATVALPLLAGALLADPLHHAMEHLLGLLAPPF
jgi:Zn-dependent protease with chaperone function